MTPIEERFGEFSPKVRYFSFFASFSQEKDFCVKELAIPSQDLFESSNRDA